jgi:hypothetical protein
MLADDGLTPILMDFGSCVKARIPIENRTQALSQQVRLVYFFHSRSNRSCDRI